MHHERAPHPPFRRNGPPSPAGEGISYCENIADVTKHRNTAIKTLNFYVYSEQEKNSEQAHTFPSGGRCRACEADEV